MQFQYPKTFDENRIWRRYLLLRCKKDRNFKAAVKTAFYKDPIFAFNAFFYTLDVRKRPFHHQPFCTYPYQDVEILNLVKHINDGRDLVWEKSRDMGATWMAIDTIAWMWLNPKSLIDALLGSRIEDYVDKKGDMRTLMEKVRYTLYKLPPWLLPKGFNKNKHDNYMRIFNPETGGSITGESNNANFSTGGRYAVVFKDEFAKWESTDRAAWTASGDATPCRFAVSTPFGAVGMFYDLVTDNITDVRRLHWSLHPEKSIGLYCEYPLDAETTDVKLRSIWYDEQCKRRTPREIAQELDIDYIGAGNPVFDGQAGKRMLSLLKSKKESIGVYTFDYVSEQFVPQPGGMFLEDVYIEWEKYDPKMTYTIGVDVAEGKEDGDFSIAKILCRETKAIVGSYYGRVDEVRFAKIIITLNERFGQPWVGIETNGPGLATYDWCAVDIPYLFTMPSYDSVKGTISHSKGWRTTMSSRRVLVAGIKEWLLERKGWADGRCIRELTTFVHNKAGKPEAKSGSNDDEVIALGIAIQVDQMSPYIPFETPTQMRPDGLSMTLFKPEKIGEPPSMEERCLAYLLEKKSDEMNKRENVQETYNDMAETYLGELF